MTETDYIQTQQVKITSKSLFSWIFKYIDETLTLSSFPMQNPCFMVLLDNPHTQY